MLMWTKVHCASLVDRTVVQYNIFTHANWWKWLKPEQKRFFGSSIEHGINVTFNRYIGMIKRNWYANTQQQQQQQRSVQTACSCCKADGKYCRQCGFLWPHCCCLHIARINEQTTITLCSATDCGVVTTTTTTEQKKKNDSYFFLSLIWDVVFGLPCKMICYHWWQLTLSASTSRARIKITRRKYNIIIL